MAEKPQLQGKKAQKVYEDLQENLTRRGIEVAPLVPVMVAYAELYADTERLSARLRKEGTRNPDGSFNKIYDKIRQNAETLLRYSKSLRLLPTGEEATENSTESGTGVYLDDF